MTRLAHDWYDAEIPPNVVVGEDVYLDTSYGFAPFASERDPGLLLGEGSGAYDRTTFVVGPHGRITVGAYTCLNGTYLVCDEAITIGAHCLIAWGVVLSDSWIEPPASLQIRQASLRTAAADPLRRLPPSTPPRPVVLEDTVWVGFDSVILPGVRLGRGCVIGSKTVVSESVPPYAVVVGTPPRIVRVLAPDDTDEVRAQALRQYARG